MKLIKNIAMTILFGAPICVWVNAPFYASFAIGALISILLDIREAVCNRR